MENENKTPVTAEDEEITESTASETEVTDTAADDADDLKEGSSGNDDSASDDVTEENEEKKEKKPSKIKINKRRLKYGSIATGITVFVIAIVVIFNVILSKAAEKVNMSIDLTEKGTFEISQETKDYLATVNEPVDIVCLSDENTFRTSNYVYYKQAYEVLRKYTIYSDNVNLTFVDMLKDPTYAERYKDQYKGEISQYSIIVSSSKRMKVMELQDLYNVEMNYQTFSQDVVSSKAEQELTSAIMYVTDPNPLNAVFFNVPTQGTCYDNMKNMLTKNGYNVSEIDPMTEKIPEDADVLVIVAPLNDFDEPLINDIYAFLDNGGALGKHLIYVADFSQKSTANIDKFLSEWGIVVGEGVVGDTDPANLQSQSAYVVRNYIQPSDYSNNVPQMDLAVLDYQARPITLTFDHADSRETVALLQTKDTGFVLTDEMRKAVENGEEPDVQNGVQTTMAIGKKHTFNDSNEMILSNVLVLGSAETLDESFTSTTYFNNGDYFISILNQMTGKNSGVYIVEKDLTSTTFDINQETTIKFLLLFVVVIPAAVLLAGIIVFIRRRKM